MICSLVMENQNQTKIKKGYEEYKIALKMYLFCNITYTMPLNQIQTKNCKSNEQ